MRNHHHLARETFLEWRRSGSPREGPEAYRMREARATFKPQEGFELFRRFVTGGAY